MRKITTEIERIVKEKVNTYELTEDEMKAVIKLIGAHNNSTRMNHGLTEEQSNLLRIMFLDNDF